MTNTLPIPPRVGPFAPWLKHVRRDWDLNQNEFAERLGCSVDTVRRCEKGTRPSQNFLELLLAQLPIPRAEWSAFIQWARADSLPEAPPSARGTTPADTPASASLPRPLTPLIGRERERQEVGALLREEATCLVTLTGEGGIGKTRLALAVAADLQEEFADGVAYVDLAPVRDPALVPAAIAAALGMIETSQQAWPARLAALLGPQELLLVLDNFEQVLAAAPLIADLLSAAPRLKAIITSRAVLELDAEYVYRLAPLPAAEAQALFMARTRAVRPGRELTAEDEEAIAGICARLDGLPLAVELAAAHSRVLTPTALLAQLMPSLPLLIGGRRDLPMRQQTLRATLDWSYGLLPPVAQQLFRRLSVFTGGVPLGALAALNQSTAAEAILDAEILINHSLLRSDEHTADPRFTMLEPVREYGYEQLLASSEEEQAQRTHAEYYLALAEQAAPALRGAQPQTWLARLDQEQANLRAALDWMVSRNQDLAGRLAGAIWPFWLARGYWSEGRRWLEAILAGKGEFPSALSASLLQGAGTLARVQGDHGPARAWLEKSLGLYRELEDLRGAAGCLYELADIVRAAGDRAGGLRLGGESVALYRAVGDPVGTAQALLFCVSEDEEAAEARWQEALALSKSIQYLPGIAMALHRLGGLAEGQDDALATALHEESLALFSELGDLRRMAMVTEVLGEVARAAGDLPRARERFEKALPLWQRVGERAGLLSVYYNFADLEQATEQWTPMAEYAARGLVEARAAGNVAGIQHGLLSLGHARFHLGQGAAALTAYGEALTYVNERTRPRMRAALLVGLGALAAHAGKFTEAGICLSAAEAQGPLSPHDQADHNQAAAAVRAGLNSLDLQSVWATGHAWTIEDIRAFSWPDLAGPALPALSI